MNNSPLLYPFFGLPMQNYTPTNFTISQLNNNTKFSNRSSSNLNNIPQLMLTPAHFLHLQQQMNFQAALSQNLSAERTATLKNELKPETDQETVSCAGEADYELEEEQNVSTNSTPTSRQCLSQQQIHEEDVKKDYSVNEIIDPNSGCIAMNSADIGTEKDDLNQHVKRPMKY